jgi:hypothetical protein
MRSGPNFSAEGISKMQGIKSRLARLALVMILAGSFPSLLRAEDAIEKAGVAVGVTAGNMWFIPAKAISTSMGLIFGSLSYVLSGGNAELTRQIWQDTTEGPYLITPDLAKKAIGERPELLERK